MANIMLTDECNLRCPYCFASEYVNKDKREISEEAFERALEFIVGSGARSTVGLIGGEPTLHSKFNDFLRKIIRDARVKRTIVYTNGVNLDRCWDLITHAKVRLLVNCNCPNDIGKDAYAKMVDNLDKLVLARECGGQATLGINMYKPDFEFDHIVALLTKYEMKTVRVSITVPNLEKDRNIDPHEYFSRMKPRTKLFFHELLSRGIVPEWDCNKIPDCLIEKSEREEFQKYLKDPETLKRVEESNLSSASSGCSPVVDIMQDLTAVRCFGLSHCTKQKIADFKGIRELERFYERTVDAYACNTVYAARCATCARRKTLACFGGCLAFKTNEILTLQNYAQTRVDARVQAEKASATRCVCDERALEDERKDDASEIKDNVD